MAGVEINDFSSPDEVRRPDRTPPSRSSRSPAARSAATPSSPDGVGPSTSSPSSATDSCQTEHVGYVVSGTMDVESDDGTTGEVTPGSVYRIAPGHDAWVIGDEPVVVVEFQGAATYAKH